MSWMNGLFGSSLGAGITLPQSAIDSMATIGSYTPEVADIASTTSDMGMFDYMKQFGSDTMDFLGDNSNMNALTSGMKGYNLYNQVQNQNQMLDIAQGNQRLEHDAYKRSTEREDRLKDLDFTSGMGA